MDLSPGFLNQGTLRARWLPVLRRHIYLVVVLAIAAGLLIEGAYRHRRATAETPARSVSQTVQDVATVPPTRFVDKSSWIYLRDYIIQVVGKATPSLVLVGELRATGVFIEGDLILVSAAAIETLDFSRVELTDGSSLQGSLVGMDEDLDIALLRLESPRGGRPLVWGSTDEPLSWVVAVGLNRFGSPVVSHALLSTTNVGDEVTGETMLRHTNLDLPKGAESAAVLDFDGRLVGYIGAKNRDRILWGDDLQDLVRRLKGQGRIRHPWLGLEVNDLDPAVLRHLKLPSGLLVSSVSYQGPAWKAGVRAGDVLLEIAGEGLQNTEGFHGVLAALGIGSNCQLKISRDGRARTLTVAVQGRTDQYRLVAGGEWIPTLGASLKAEQDVTLPEGVRLSGLRVTYVERNGPAYTAGIRPEDLLLSVGRRPILSARRLSRLLRDSQPLLVQLARGDRQYLVLLKIPDHHEAP
jgi:S1-C subfamily serine protease